MKVRFTERDLRLGEARRALYAAADAALGAKIEVLPLPDLSRKDYDRIITQEEAYRDEVDAQRHHSEDGNKP